MHRKVRGFVIFFVAPFSVAIAWLAFVTDFSAVAKGIAQSGLGELAIILAGCGLLALPQKFWRPVCRLCWTPIRHWLAQREKARILANPYFAQGRCSYQAFRELVFPQLRRCTAIHDPSNGHWVIVV